MVGAWDEAVASAAMRPCREPSTNGDESTGNSMSSAVGGGGSGMHDGVEGSEGSGGVTTSKHSSPSFLPVGSGIGGGGGCSVSTSGGGVSTGGDGAGSIFSAHEVGGMDSVERYIRLKGVDVILQRSGLANELRALYHCLVGEWTVSFHVIFRESVQKEVCVCVQRLTNTCTIVVGVARRLLRMCDNQQHPLSAHSPAGFSGFDRSCSCSNRSTHVLQSERII